MSYRDSTPELVRDRRSSLWLVGVLFYGVGDVVTTTIGLRTERVVEVGPFVAPVVEQYWVVGMLALKLVLFGLCYLLYRVVPSPHDAGIPLGLAAFGVLVSGWNVFVLIRALQ